MVSTKVKAPAESAEQKAARERAERDAEERNINERRRTVTAEQEALLRRFGIRSGGSTPVPSRADGFGNIAATGSNVGGGGSATNVGAAANIPLFDFAAFRNMNISNLTP